MWLFLTIRAVNKDIKSKREFCGLWKQFFASNSPQTPSNLISLTIVVTVRSFTQLWAKIKAIKLQKGAKIWLTW